MTAQAFDGDFIAEAGHHNLTIANFFGGFDGQQVAIHDACVSHGHAAHAKQVVGLFLEKVAFDVVGAVDMFLGQNRGASCHAAYEWQCQLGKTRQRHAEKVCGLARVVAGRAFESNASGCAADQIDGAFSGQGLKVFFCSVGRFEA